MSLNIGTKILDVCTSIDATVDLTRLSTRQLSNLKRQYTTGHVQGTGVPAQLAIKLLRAERRPYVHRRRYACLSWSRIPVSENHPARAALIACMVASELCSDVKSYYAQVIQYTRRDIMSAENSGWCQNVVVTPLKSLNLNNPLPAGFETGVVKIDLLD